MNIRPATIVDSIAIDALLGDAYAVVVSRMLPNDGLAFNALLPRVRAKYAEKGLWLVAEAQGQIVGCVVYFSPGATEHPLFLGNSAHVQLLAVSPSQTKQGVGRKLMDYCLSMASKDRASEFRLQTSELMPEARKLYESLGFEVKEVLAPVWGQPTYLYSKKEAQGGFA
jgi:ribosomal protein S18 acetylase RimI-like enzyme